MNERPRVVVVGGGFAGFHAARNLAKRLGDDAEIVLVSATDYFLYLPAAARGRRRRAGAAADRGARSPRACRGCGVVLGEVDDDRPGTPAASAGRTPRAAADGITYDRLLLAVGSVNKLLPIPGVAEHAHGFREPARGDVPARPHHPPDRARRRHRRPRRAGGALHVRRRRRRLHRDGGGRAGRAVHRPAASPRTRSCATSRCAGCCSTPRSGCCPSWTSGCRRTADRVLRERGVEVRMGAVGRGGRARRRAADHRRGRADALADLVRRGAGGPAGREPGAEDREGARRRRRVHARARASRGVRVRRRGGRAGRDPPRPGDGDDRPARAAAGQARGPQHRGVARARAPRRRYKHHDLGFVVELGGRDAAANPLHVPLAGLPAKAVTRGYHLTAMPGNRSARRPTGCSTPCCRARPCSSGWCGRTPCRWRPRPRSARTAPDPRTERPRRWVRRSRRRVRCTDVDSRGGDHRDVTRCHAQVTRPRFPPGTLRFMVIDADRCA